MKDTKGSITPYGDRWRLKIRGTHIGIYDTYEEAAERAEAFIELSPDMPPSDIATLRTFGANWFDEREKSGVVRSVQRERSCWNKHVMSAHFIDWPLKRISQHEIQKWLGQLGKTEAVSAITVGRRAGEDRHAEYRPTGDTLKKKTIDNVRGVLKQCLAQAVIEGKMANNPITKELRARVAARVIEDEEEAWTFLTVPELGSVRTTVVDIRRWAYYACGIYGGLRQGEVIGLRWRDLDFNIDKPQIKVRRSHNGPTKTKHSRREVPMLPVLYEALREWKAAVDLALMRGKHSRDVVRDLNALVFPSDHGGCFAKGYDCGWADRRYRKKKDGPIIVYPGWRSRSNVREQVTFHCLRHTCASMLVMGGPGFPKLTLYEVSRWLGHSSIAVTQRYAHLDPDFLNERVGRMFKFKLVEGARDDD